MPASNADSSKNASSSTGHSTGLFHHPTALKRQEPSSPCSGQPPLHLGVDNSLAVSNLNKIINGTRTANSKPWELIPHGDIWKKVEQAIQQRRPGTTRITKDKGHAAQQHIIDEITTEEHKEGNDIADGLATKAYQCFGHVKESANLITHRTQLYTEYVQVIQLTIIRVVDALQERRRTMALINLAQVGTYVKGVKQRPMVLRPLDSNGNTDKDITLNQVKQADVQHLSTK